MEKKFIAEIQLDVKSASKIVIDKLDLKLNILIEKLDFQSKYDAKYFSKYTVISTKQQKVAMILNL